MDLVHSTCINLGTLQRRMTEKLHQDETAGAIHQLIYRKCVAEAVWVAIRHVSEFSQLCEKLLQHSDTERLVKRPG